MVDKIFSPLRENSLGTAQTAPARQSSLVRPASLSRQKAWRDPCPLGLPDVPQPSPSARKGKRQKFSPSRQTPLAERGIREAGGFPSEADSLFLQLKLILNQHSTFCFLTLPLPRLKPALFSHPRASVRRTPPGGKGEFA